MPINTSFDYTKKWTNPDDFSTYEENEAKVREDMQLLFDQIRDALNTLAGQIVAANVPFTATEAIPGVDNVADAIAAVQAQLAAAVLSQMVPDGSITAAKLAAKAVESGKIDDGAVDTNQLADEAVTGEKIEDEAITGDKLALTGGGFVPPAINLVSGVHYFDSVAALEAALPTADVGRIAFVKV